MNEMQAHGLLIPVGSKPLEVWIDKNNSLAELQDLVNGNVEVLRVLGNGVDLWVNDEGLLRVRLYSARTRTTAPTAVAISAICVHSTASIQSVINQSSMNRFKETRR